ncbi:MAG TPA: MYXO-CTERM sorting domain-containing protein [Byssovorax sp.]|jgi:MYXO-CTERM domain-containing protein
MNDLLRVFSLRARALLLASSTLAFATAVAAPARAIEPQDRSEDEARREQARFNWWHTQRSSPAPEIPAGALLRARAHFAALPHIGRGAARVPGPPGGPGVPGPPTSPDGFSWSFLGPSSVDTTMAQFETPNMGPEAGRASSLVIDPTNPQVLYVGYSAGGVWKSTDGGATWSALGDQQASLAIGSIAVDPTNPQTIYAGTGEDALFAGFYGAGLLRSDDGGGSWTTVGASTFTGVTIPRLLVDPTTGDLYAGTIFGTAGRGQGCTNVYESSPNQGVFHSRDHGQTWDKLLDGQITDLEIDFTQTPLHMMVVDFKSGVKRSVDGGQSWNNAAGLPANSSEIGIELAMAPTNSQVVYAGVGESGGTLYVSQDGGATFTKTVGTPGYCEEQCYWDDSVIVDPTDPATVWLGGSLCGVWKTTNALDPTPTWINVSAFHEDCGNNDATWFLGNVHPDVHALAIEPGNPLTFYAVTDGGISVTHDGGTSWARINNGVGTIQLYEICLDPNDPETVYGGAQDNGSSMRSGDPLWRGLASGDGGYCAVNIGDSNNVLTTDSDGTIFRTTDKFGSTPTEPFATECSPGQLPGCGDRSGFITPLIGDPVTAGTFYIGTFRLYQSTDTGLTWAPISPDLTAGTNAVGCNGAGSQDDTITAIAVGKGTPKTIYTGSAAGVVQATTDGGQTWRVISNATLPARWVSDITIDPRDDKRIFIAYSGFDAATPGQDGHVFSSTDGGTTYTLADPLVDAPVDALVQHPVARGLLYAGTDVGVLVTNDSGKTWAALGDDTLPNAPAFAVRFHEQKRRLVAATHGRGAWSIDFGPGALDAAPTSVTFSANLGDPAPAAKTANVTDTDPYGSVAEFDATSSATWLTVTASANQTAGTDAAVLTLTPSVTGLGAGEQDATVTLTPRPGTSGSPITITVKLTLKAPGDDASGASDSGGGCGCRVAEPSPASPIALSIAAALALIAARRRRRA